MVKILKQNEYKCVELHEPTNAIPFVVKRYSGQGKTQDRVNTQYIVEALYFFHSEFSDTLTTPQPLDANLESFEVSMEYIPELPTAKKLALGNLPIAKPFFEKCYGIRDDQGFLRSARDSVMCTPTVKELLDSDFPVSLGFKGDLSENLVLGKGKLILADIDSIALEPLGLSELLLYTERFASSQFYPALKSFLRLPARPIAFRYLTMHQASILTKASLDVFAQNMNKLPKTIQRLKAAISHHLLNQMVQNYSLR